MAEITGITPQIKNKNRCNIELDGRFFCGMPLETVMRHHLKAGMRVTEEELSALQLESEKNAAFDKALSYIGSSMKTERELRDHLKKLGYLSDVCDYVVEKMDGYGFLDDAAYAAAYASSAGKRKGRRLIAAELKRKGVSDEEISSAIERCTCDEESAKEVLAKYLRGKTLSAETLRKAYAYLVGKGYEYDTARDAIRSLGETEDED